MQAFTGIASKLRKPQSLALRAVLFTAFVVIVTAALSAGIVLWGAQREGERQELEITRDLTQFLASRAGVIMQNGNTRVLTYMLRGSARENVRSVSIRDAEGHVLAQDGGGPADNALMAALTRQVVAEGRATYRRTADGAIATAAPIMRNGQVAGVALRMWEHGAYRFDALPALAPFLLILACLMCAAVPVTAYVVRRAILPLDSLAQFAARVGEHGHTGPIELKTGDEFETLANAFNQMTARIDSSMQRIQQIAFVDPTTQLPNHDRFVRELDFHILQAKGEADVGSVMVFELTRLPKLMQTLDPDATRELLRIAAQRFATAAQTIDRAVMRGGKREQGSVVAARLGAVEFGVFVPGLVAPAEAARFAQHLNAALNQPFDWRGHKLMIGACCGVAVAHRDAPSADIVIRRARMALAVAETSPTKLKVFTPSLDREAMARLTLEREMRGALERNEFRAYFQPKINLATGRIEACEALARWVRPDRTIVSPGRFIPVAEESGLIGPLSEAIMREACWKAAAWARAGMPAKVAVNVSALQFRDDRFAERVLQIVQHAGLAPSNLELEITESVVMEDPDRALRIIAPLRTAGVRLAIDDFGCGHSSLAALSKLPFDVIKIDQQFIRALERGDEQAGAIIDMILALARALKLEVVAEGVERPEHVDFMAGRGCQWVQGFVYGAAVSAPEFVELLRKQAGEEIMSEDAA
jgi:EAL domain-containing protein (putative c-di-GMP-specific phosphodiesterase class I)/GGDEF domain-containing protein